MRRDCLFLFFFPHSGWTSHRKPPWSAGAQPATRYTRHMEKKRRRVLIRQKLERPEREPTVIILLLNANLQAANNSATATTPKRDVYILPPIQPSRVSSFSCWRAVWWISLITSLCCFVCVSLSTAFFHLVFRPSTTGHFDAIEYFPPAPLDRN